MNPLKDKKYNEFFKKLAKLETNINKTKDCMLAEKAYLYKHGLI